MCEICRQEPCDSRCPNFIAPHSSHKCYFCRDDIQIGEEYIENYTGDFAHLECCHLSSLNEVLELFLDINVKRMENEL